jgi:Cytochrome c554 and c-prime
MSRKLFNISLVVFLSPFALQGAAALEVVDSPLVLGNTSCATSGCHGGAGPVHGTLMQFNREDVHARSFGTLATPRSARMGEALGIADVTTSASCTACHAPAANVPVVMRGGDLRVEDGVGCASCHESSASWLRAHTRTDLTHAEKVATGMRDLRSTYQRANTCVACHQVIESRLVEVGRHPRLIFELDGQTASEPRHWREAAGYAGTQAWFVGQAVAWREAAAARVSGGDTLAGVVEREQALAWLVRRAGGAWTADKSPDAIAREADASGKTIDAVVLLRALAATGGDFRDVSVTRLEQAYRAERLVLGLDRLLAAWSERTKAKAAGPALEQLFAAAQSVPDFTPATFAGLLDTFAVVIGE